MGKILVIGGTGLLGRAVVNVLGEGRCIVASRNAQEHVDISDPASTAALFDRVGEVDGIISACGAARFVPWDKTKDDDWAFGVANKMMGQINIARLGAGHVRAGGAIVLSSGVLAQNPMPGGAMVTTINSAIEGFVLGASVEGLPVRVNAVSPGWVSETLQAMGMDPSSGVPAAEVALAYVKQLEEGASGSGPGLPEDVKPPGIGTAPDLRRG